MMKNLNPSSIGRMLGSLVDRACPMCERPQLRVHFVYDRQPPGEFQFDFLQGSTYRRELHRCDGCGHLLEWIDADLSRLYQGDYAAKVWGNRESIKRTFDRINTLPPEQSDNVGRVAYIQAFTARTWPAERLKTPRLLDVGSGLGVFPYRMKQTGWESVSLDLDETLVSHVREAVGIQAILGDVTKIEGIGEFDLITFNKVLEHTDNPIRILSSVGRLLKPGGLVYIELPDGEGAEIEGQEREEYLLGHIHVFSLASYALLAARAGFELVACERLREPSTKFTLRGFARSPAQPSR